MKYIIEIDGVKSTRYKYNIWSTFQNEDGSVSQDIREFETDSIEEFTLFLSKLRTPQN